MLVKTIMIPSSLNRKLRKGRLIMEQHGYTLRDYQVDGVKWMVSQELKKEFNGGILADDPGLGKTIQTAALMAAIPKKTLIIVPTAVLTQWYNIMGQIFGFEQVYMHYGSDRMRSKQDIISLDFSICITSHMSSVSRKKKCFKTILHIPSFWERIIIDEGHVIRNNKTKMYKTRGCEN